VKATKNGYESWVRRVRYDGVGDARLLIELPEQRLASVTTTATTAGSRRRRQVDAVTTDRSKPSDNSSICVTCPNCGQHDYVVAKTPGHYKFKCPNTRYVLGCGKYVLITVKKNGKVVAR